MHATCFVRVIYELKNLTAVTTGEILQTTYYLKTVHRKNVSLVSNES